ncbi:MAG: 3-hydroxyacyl-CoA dehydrogenase family protein [Bacteroidota bacterium]
MSQIKKVGIIGEGKMGSGIFNWLVDFDFALSWVCSCEADTSKIIRQFGKKIQRSLDAGIIDRKRYEILQQTSISCDMNTLQDCDLVIEAIPENLELKRSLFLQLDNIVNAEAIFTSNSSSINPSEIAPPGKRSGLFAGLHFFYPVLLKNIVELTLSADTSIQTNIALESFLTNIRKRFITLEEKNSFILNKIFLDFQNEAYKIVKSGHCTYAQLDQLVKNHIFSFGVFDFCDSVGIDTMFASVQNYTRDYPHKDYYSQFLSALNDLISQGRLGAKSDDGFYKYPLAEFSDEQPAGSSDIVEHLRQTWLSASKRFTAQSHIPIYDINWAIKEYFGIEKGPFDK